MGVSVPMKDHLSSRVDKLGGGTVTQLRHRTSDVGHAMSDVGCRGHSDVRREAYGGVTRGYVRRAAASNGV
jgi:hypothetical protein